MLLMFDIRRLLHTARWYSFFSSSIHLIVTIERIWRVRMLLSRNYISWFHAEAKGSDIQAEICRCWKLIEWSNWTTNYITRDAPTWKKSSFFLFFLNWNFIYSWKIFRVCQAVMFKLDVSRFIFLCIFPSRDWFHIYSENVF